MLKIQNNTLQDGEKLDNLPANTNSILATKQDKETGKGLSTNDFSNTDKAKLDGLSNYTLPTASDSVLGGVKVDGTTITITDGVISSSGGGGGGSGDMTKAVYDPANGNKQVAFKDEVVPYTGATSDVDLDTHKLSAVSLQIKGTGGAGHLALKHQSAGITASTSESSLGANNSGNPIWKNDGNTQQNIMLENTAITGATKTKITYDSKGLVTAGADATTADIADSINKRYVTDSQLVVIGNTSNTNSGDETKASIESKLTGTITSHNHSGVYQPLATVLTNTTASYTTTIDTRLANTSGTNTGDNAVNSLYSGLATSKQDTLVSGTNIKTINGTTLLGSGDITISGGGSITDHNLLTGLQGGNVGDYQHLTTAQVTNLNNQSGVNTGDETKATIESKLTGDISSHTHDGRYYTETETNTLLSNKVDKSTTITINGVTQDLSANRTFTVSGGASFDGIRGQVINIAGEIVPGKIAELTAFNSGTFNEMQISTLTRTTGTTTVTVKKNGSAIGTATITSATTTTNGRYYGTSTDLADSFVANDVITISVADTGSPFGTGLICNLK